jgi:hypothetical protein
MHEADLFALDQQHDFQRPLGVFLSARGMRALERIMSADPGRRGIAAFFVSGELECAARALLAATRGVAVLSGFPCVVGHAQPTENDGVSGAVAIARAALLLGKPRVSIVTDECNRVVFEACVQALLATGTRLGEDWASRLQLQSFPSAAGWRDADSAAMDDVVAQHDHWVAIERSGCAADGNYYTMRGRSMNDLVAPLDPWFARVESSTGIGDGGNELGSVACAPAAAAARHSPCARCVWSLVARCTAWARCWRASDAASTAAT